MLGLIGREWTPLADLLPPDPLQQIAAELSLAILLTRGRVAATSSSGITWYRRR